MYRNERRNEYKRDAMSDISRWGETGEMAVQWSTFKIIIDPGSKMGVGRGLCSSTLMG